MTATRPPRLGPGPGRPAAAVKWSFLLEHPPQGGLLLLGEVGVDQLGRLLGAEAVLDPVENGARRHEEKRRGARCDLVADLLDEAVVDADVGHRARQGA